jgi:hypothetical protein
MSIENSGMSPMQFITDCGEQHNDPVGAVIAALQKPMLIHSQGGSYVVVSYYFSEEDGCMVMDIQDKSEIDEDDL